MPTTNFCPSHDFAMATAWISNSVNIVPNLAQTQTPFHSCAVHFWIDIQVKSVKCAQIHNSAETELYLQRMFSNEWHCVISFTVQVKLYYFCSQRAGPGELCVLEEEVVICVQDERQRWDRCTRSMCVSSVCAQGNCNMDVFLSAWFEFTANENMLHKT